MRPVWVGLLVMFIVAAVLLLLLIYIPELLVHSSAQRQQDRSALLAIGPYLAEVSLSENPAVVGRPLNVNVVPRGAAPLTGELIAVALAGTDSNAIHVQLSTDPSHPAVLAGSLQLPLRGSWRIMVELNGPQGRGSAGIPLTSVVPFVLPAWIGWLLGLSPLVGCAWFVWHQRSYRRQLLSGAHTT